MCNVTKDGENTVYTPMENNGYFHTTLSIRVEKHSAKDEIEEEYGSYDAIIKKINGLKDEIEELNGNIDSMEASMKEIITGVNERLNTSYDVNAEDLVSEYEKAVGALMEALNSSVEGVQGLIASVNEIYKTDITLKDNATPEDIRAAISAALKAIKDDQEAKKAAITELKQDYVDIANSLSGYMEAVGDLNAESVDKATIAKIKKAVAAVAADLNNANKNLKNIDAALDNLYIVLDKAFGSMGITPPGTHGASNESAADRIDSVSGMISLIAESYNDLQKKYSSLSDNYQKVLDYIYGDDGKSVDKVTAEDVKQQIEKNQTEAINKAVAEALKQAENMTKDSVSVQQQIAECIDKIKKNENYNTTGLTGEMANALAQVESLQAQVNSLQQGSDAMASFLSSVSEALGYDDVLTQTQIIAAIHGMRQHIDELTAANRDLTEKNKMLSENNVSLKNENSILLTKNGELAAKVEELTSANRSLTEKNKTLSEQNAALKNENSTLSAQNETLAKDNDSLKSQVSALNSTKTSLESQLSNTKKSSTTVSSYSAPAYKTPASTASYSQPGVSGSNAAQTPSITVNAKNNKKDAEASDKEEKEEETADKTDKKIDIPEKTEMSEKSAKLEILPGSDNTYSNNMQEDTEYADDITEDDSETDGNSIVPVLFGLAIIVMIGSILFVFVIKPRLASRGNFEDEDEDDDDINDETV